MKAVALTEFGEPGVLSLRELPDPLVGPDTVLVETRAAGVNPVDWKVRRGYLQGAFPHHTPLISGWDVSGVVRAAGPAVTEYQPGDEVVGYVRKDHVQNGTYAEFVSAPDRTLAHKPRELEFTEAAGLPLAGLTALQMLQAVAAGTGDTILVHAAAGGVGHLAVQIAAELGVTRVIGTASEANHTFLREVGAEPVTYGDGLPERVAELVGGHGKVDAALDLVGGQALIDTPAMVHDAGRHASVQEPDTVKAQGGHYIFVRPNSPQLGWLAELAAVGRIRVRVQHTFPLGEAAQAHELLEQGHVQGKLVLTAT